MTIRVSRSCRLSASAVGPAPAARHTPAVSSGTRLALAAIVPAAPDVRLATSSVSEPVSTLNSAPAVA